MNIRKINSVLMPIIYGGCVVVFMVGMYFVQKVVNGKVFSDNKDVEYVDGEITEKADIEKILDSLLDFGDDERFYELFRKLCRHVYTKHPDTAVEYLNIFRIGYMQEDNKDLSNTS